MGVSKRKQKCPGTPSFERANRAINMHSRRPTKQRFYVLEPSHGCLHKGKKCPGTPSFQRANKAINMHSRRPTEQRFYVLEPSHGCL